jgi:SAM-dependent methyltransferase
MAILGLAHPRSVPAVHGRSELQEKDFERSVWPYRLILPFMFLIAVYVHAKKLCFGALSLRVQRNFCLVDGISINSRRVKEGAAKWPALDACYNFTVGEGSNALVRGIDLFWMRVRNAQAVRNRLKIVKRELSGAIMHMSRTTDGEPVRILSLAAGTAQGVVEVMADMRAAGYKTHATLIDRDRTALRYARELARRYDLEDSIEIIEGDVVMFDRVTRGFEPHIVEMCGLMDYLRTSLAEKLVRKIRAALAPSGIFLTCHVHPNAETYFLRHVVDWDMLYRTRGEFQDILIKGNFLDPRLTPEPHGIHSVAYCTK